jgi:hypothetical protein
MEATTDPTNDDLARWQGVLAAYGTGERPAA